MKFMDLIKIERITPNLKSTTKEEVIKEMLATFDFPEGEFEKNCELVIAREAKGTTGMGEGIAIPHTNEADVPEVIGAFGRSINGVEFQSLDGELVHLFFMVLSPVDKRDQHIEGIKYISKQMRTDIFKRFSIVRCRNRLCRYLLLKLNLQVHREDGLYDPFSFLYTPEAHAHKC